MLFQAEFTLGSQAQNQTSALRLVEKGPPHCGHCGVGGYSPVLPTVKKLMAHICDPNTGEIGTEEGSRVQNHPQPRSELGSSLGYMSLFIKTSKIKINRQ